MSGYQPIFRSILDSSIARDHVVRHIFEDLLKLANWLTGEVDMTPDAIARRTNVPLDLVEHALKELAKPDSSSRSPDHEGRRIVLIDPARAWGWQIVNYGFYREETRLEGKRRRQAAYRERRAGGTERPPGRPKKPVTEGASRGDAKRRGGARENW